jgi:hypothetical protein
LHHPRELQQLVFAPFDRSGNTLSEVGAESVTDLEAVKIMD